MIVRRSLKRPGAIQFESAGYEVEISPEDFGLKPAANLVEGRMNLHILFREARIAILLQAVIDGVMAPEEYQHRLKSVQTELPAWLRNPDLK